MGTVERAAPAEEPESKLDVLTAAHGTTRDTAQRYLMAANDDLPAAHRLLQASRVRASSGSLSPLSPWGCQFWLLVLFSLRWRPSSAIMMLGSFCCPLSTALGVLVSTTSAVYVWRLRDFCSARMLRSIIVCFSACGSIFIAPWLHCPSWQPLMLLSVCFACLFHISDDVRIVPDCACLCCYAISRVSTWHAWRLMQEWREVKLQGKDMLQQPQPHYEAFKALFSHGVLGFSFSGRPIWVMKVCLAPACQC